MPYYITQDGTQIYYEDHGKGEPIVFLHGVTAAHQNIKSFIDEFKGEYRCVSYDHRGHGASNHKSLHMNLQTLAQDLHELLEYLDLQDVTVIGHSLGSATIFSYVNQFGCDRLKRIVGVDMSPCVRNADGWKGGMCRGEWADEDFMQDLDRIFNNIADQLWVINADLCMPALKATPAEMLPAMIANCKEYCSSDAFTLAGLWYSMYRTDNRCAADKITVPYMYVLPETPLIGVETVDYLREHVKGGFTLADVIPGTTHIILLEKPHEVADQIKAFMKA